MSVLCNKKHTCKYLQAYKEETTMNPKKTIHVGFRIPIEYVEFIDSLEGTRSSQLVKAVRVYKKLIERKRAKEQTSESGV